MKKLDNAENHGTVGCVVSDDQGNLCASTSTGGRIYQAPGRVGDSPLVGCGFLCTDEVAVSTTGVGEAIMRTQLARTVSDYYSESDLDVAVDNALIELEETTGRTAGVISVSKDGEWSADYNSTDMIFAGKSGSS